MALQARARQMFLAENAMLKLHVFNYRNRRFWVHKINVSRQEYGEYHHLMPQLRADEEKFKNYFRMNITTFNVLLELIKEDIEKVTINFRRPISAEERLVVALRFMATGNYFHSLAFSFRMGVSTVAAIVRNVCESIWRNVQPLHMPALTGEMCVNAAKEFLSQWQFPNCFGCIDGKHIRIKCPPNTGSMFYNYKHYFSIILQGVAGANCRFLAIDVGARGKQSDGGVLSESAFYKCLQSDQFNLAVAQKLPDSDKCLPLVILGDEAYPLQNNIMRPFPRANLTREKTIFNYRLSRARRTVECAFGIMSGKFRILGTAIETKPETVDAIVKAVCVLHNMILDREGVPTEFSENDTVLAIRPVTNQRVYTRYAGQVRDSFMEYFCNEGAVPWQNDRL